MTEADVARQLIINLSQCNPKVQQDVLKRCSDWIQSGGYLNDNYIVNNLRYTFRCFEATQINSHE